VLRFALSCLVLVSALALLACGGGAGSPAGVSPGPNFKIYVTDAPFPADLVESASVVIERIEVRERALGWQTAFEGSETVDLVPLTGGVSMLLVAIDLEPGVYEEVRLIVEAGEVTLKPEAFVRGGSRTFTTGNGGLFYPSGAQTGIKVKLDTEIVVVTQLTSELTLDFDLSRNFVFNGPMSHAPGVSRVIFTPVVRAVNSSSAGRVELEAWSDNATPGILTDDVALAGATVRAFDGAGTEVGGGLTDAQGFLSLQLPAGTYTIQVEAANHETMASNGVAVALANLTDLGPVLLAATSGEITGVVFGDGATPGDDADDVVVAGADVTATPQAGGTPVVTTTDAQGAFRFEGLAPGLYDLSVGMAGFMDGGIANVAPTLGGTGVTVTLAAFTRTLTGTVTDGAATPAALAGASVTATNAAGVPVGSTTTDAAGAYSLVLATGDYTVRFAAAAPSTDETSVSVSVVGTDPVSDQTLDATVPAAP